MPPIRYTLFGSLVVLMSAFHAHAALDINDTAPKVSLQTRAGQKLTVDFREKVTVLMFWRTGQDYSLKALGDLQKLRGDSQSGGVQIVAICAGPAEAKALAEIVDTLKLSITLLLDPNRNAYASYGVFVSPATFVIDKAGKVRFYRPSYSSNYFGETRLDVAMLLGKISEQQHASRRAGDMGALSKEAKAANSNYKLGLQLLRHGDREAAEGLFRKVWSTGANHVSAGIQLGFLLLGKNDNAEALQIFTEIRSIEPDQLSAKGGQAIAMIRQGKKADGLTRLEQVLSEGASDPSLCFEMGRAFEELGKRDDALESYKQGLRAALPSK